MTDTPGLPTQYRKSSPWPMLIALGIALSEVGIILGLIPIAVGGLVLLLGSIGGVLKETEYVTSPFPVFIGLSSLLIPIGLGIFWYVGGTITPDLAISASHSGIALRGLSIAVAGVFGIVLAAVLRSRLHARPEI